MQENLKLLEQSWLPEYDFNITVNNSASTFSKQISRLKKQLEKNLASSSFGKVQQKIRICEDDKTEFQLRVTVLSVLVVIITLAATATYKLHKIADYEV